MPMDEPQEPHGLAAPLALSVPPLTAPPSVARLPSAAPPPLAPVLRLAEGVMMTLMQPSDALLSLKIL
jgi:hypothetical protein